MAPVGRRRGWNRENPEEFQLVTSTAMSNSAPSVEDAPQPVVGAARYLAVPTLMDSLLHDVRNPLNALAIHLEVLSEKLKVETGSVPPSQEKNLKAMRDQIQRVDGILKLFSDFVVFRGGVPGVADLSEATTRALGVLGHEGRKRRVQVQAAVEAGVQIRLQDTSELGFFLIQTLLRAFRRAENGGSIRVTVRGDETSAVLEVEDSAGACPEPLPEAVAALQLRCSQLGVDLHVRAGLCRLSFSRA
ncbi:putative sensor histidine kinase [Myxococcus xanthus DK 1622]|uniref:histidine kinase n=1 Tax=Myxococcus xanthus (strain DK1622) TaxID=246197 RepID=Q1D551_MYXXD|nr:MULTISPECIES: histidine kinase dimerization/phospho-acceptor domain-containing protein [Myxococcus]ABF89947.1 putative sensor histidine kinase [Myxococcus xanthus DK 1622]NOJ51531.1 HAMP domain-containing histidine kinase [Myxococcus xanthus]QPM76663.1 HAMP domain-containing histidine kinase [Myxococcus xanthus]QVW65728.1 HAMP domain-containing histidine kinase [Myxococcus xanthus DZ2]UEO08140.1 HAMP domain-containing histidine kinase [Myxococcus xanthus DZ2]